ncbi:hypothetical protein HQO83_21525 [Rhodococcus fascians]|nr:hypothetical protein [Rhodococcus fascians]
MTSAFDARVRRPEAHEPLLKSMMDDAGFSTMRDALLFAAAVGIYIGRKAPFGKAYGDSIRYEILTKESFSDAFISMIAANETDDPEILGNDRIDDRLKTFEQYMVGGFEYIQELVNTRSQPVELVVSSLVTEALSELGNSDPASIEDLLDGY